MCRHQYLPCTYGSCGNCEWGGEMGREGVGRTGYKVVVLPTACCDLLIKFGFNFVSAVE